MTINFNYFLSVLLPDYLIKKKRFKTCKNPIAIDVHQNGYVHPSGIVARYTFFRFSNSNTMFGTVIQNNNPLLKADIIKFPWMHFKDRPITSDHSGFSTMNPHEKKRLMIHRIISGAHSKRSPKLFLDIENFEVSCP